MAGLEACSFCAESRQAGAVAGPNNESFCNHCSKAYVKLHTWKKDYVVVSQASSSSPPPPDPRPVLSRQEAKEVYNKIYKKVNDTESPYGGPSSELLVELAAFDSLPNDPLLVEFGHGQGSFAYRLFTRGLVKDTCRYIGVDQSPVMHERASEKLASYTSQVELRLTDGNPHSGTADISAGSVDRFISTFVLDLLSEADIRDVLAEAKRLIKPKKEGALVCLSGITFGNSFSSKLASALWQIVYFFRKDIVGGCRPQMLAPYVREAGFEIVAEQVVQGDRKSLLGLMNSEVVIARLPS